MAYLNLGTSLIALGRCQEAASVLREASKLDGVGLRDRSAHENARIASLLQLGGLYADQGKLQRALAVYREALHTLPERYPPQVCFFFFYFLFQSKPFVFVVCYISFRSQIITGHNIGKKRTNRFSYDVYYFSIYMKMKINHFSFRFV